MFFFVVRGLEIVFNYVYSRVALASVHVVRSIVCKSVGVIRIRVGEHISAITHLFVLISVYDVLEFVSAVALRLFVAAGALQEMLFAIVCRLEIVRNFIDSCSALIASVHMGRSIVRKSVFMNVNASVLLFSSAFTRIIKIIFVCYGDIKVVSHFCS